MPQFPATRLRRLRQNPAVRSLIRQTAISPDELISPLFIHHGEGIHKPITSMPGVFQLSCDQLEAEIGELKTRGLNKVILFGLPAHKDPEGSDACAEDGIIAQAIRTIKSIDNDFLVISDVCLCEYTDHGHCGVVNDNTGRLDVDNDATLALLAKQAITHAKAGADLLAPSGAIDGMVGAIRSALDSENYSHLPILSYAVKYASNFYGPFREAADGAPQFGDRKSYQMDYANSDEALRECALDLEEGADMLMVKPALPYLDILCRIKQQYPGVPLGAYMVSGEYAMLQAADANGWLDASQTFIESLTCIKRAGADFILCYCAKMIAELID